MEKIQHQMVEAKKKNVNALITVKCFCKVFGFTARMLKGTLAEDRKKNEYRTS
jgi:hypothetical protein